VGKKREEVIWIISYKPLFKLLLEKDMTKTQLREAVGFSSSTLAKMSKGEYVSLETIDNICQHLNCKVEDVIEVLQTK
jgi:DNA-binding Xre family transcriptional regulator